MWCKLGPKGDGAQEKLTKDKKLQRRGRLQTPTGLSAKKAPQRILVKLLKTKDKEEHLEGGQRKKSECLQKATRRQWLIFHQKQQGPEDKERTAEECRQHLSTCKAVFSENTLQKPK